MNNFFVYAVTTQICATLVFYVAIAVKMRVERYPEHRVTETARFCLARSRERLQVSERVELRMVLTGFLLYAATLPAVVHNVSIHTQETLNRGFSS